ncbi:hypothetical protein Pmani_015876 [Petrolisthes manimaculis]|uniref:Uncharacterized protein n=1 Tax=Petrolisthes manimaculis TaxID=1843537 RepID=A0AAE1UB65_9EUCA|nr:hypothetical protein Pmani_015876 [Petrolisthes manimaculis]
MTGILFSSASVVGSVLGASVWFLPALLAAVAYYKYDEIDPESRPIDRARLYKEYDFIIILPPHTILPTPIPTFLFSISRPHTSPYLPSLTIPPLTHHTSLHSPHLSPNLSLPTHLPTTAPIPSSPTQSPHLTTHSQHNPPPSHS